MSGIKHIYTLNENIVNKYTENRAVNNNINENQPLSNLTLRESFTLIIQGNRKRTK